MGGMGPPDSGAGSAHAEVTTQVETSAARKKVLSISNPRLAVRSKERHRQEVMCGSPLIYVGGAPQRIPLKKDLKTRTSLRLRTSLATLFRDAPGTMRTPGEVRSHGI